PGRRCGRSTKYEGVRRRRCSCAHRGSRIHPPLVCRRDRSPSRGCESMVARVCPRLDMRLAFEGLHHDFRDVRVIDLFACAVHDAPAALDLEGEPTEATLVRDLWVVIL